MDETEPTKKSEKGKPTKTERGSGRYKLLLVFNPFMWPYYSFRYVYHQSSGFSASSYITVILIVAGASGAFVTTVVVATALGLIPVYIAAAGGGAGAAGGGAGGGGAGAGVASKLVTIENVAMFELDTSVVNLNDFSNGNQFGVKTAEIEKSVSFSSFFFEFF